MKQEKVKGVEHICKEVMITILQKEQKLNKAVNEMRKE